MKAFTRYKIISKSILTYVFHPIALLASGSIASQVISLLAYPIITRLYSPESFGYLSLFISFIAVTSEISSLGYHHAIIGIRNESDKSILFFISIVLCFISAIFFSFFYYFLINRNVMSFGLLPYWTLFFICPILLLSGWINVLRYKLVGEGGFATITKGSVSQSLTKSISLIFIGLVLKGASGLFFSELISRLTIIYIMSSNLWKGIKQDIKTFLNKENISRILRKYSRYPTWILPSTILDIIAVNILLPVIVHLFGPTVGGNIGLVQRTIILPFSIVSVSVADVFHKQAAALMKESPRELPSLLLKTCKNLMLLGLIPSAAIFFFAPRIFPIFFSSQWQDSGLFASAIIPWIYAGFIVSPVSRLIFLSDFQEYKFVYDITSLSLSVFSLYASFFMQLDVIKTLSLFSCLQVVAYILYFLLLLRIAYSPNKRHISR